MPPTSQFLNMDETINCVVSNWTLWKNPTVGNVDGELSIGQIFPSKSDLQHVMKMYSIKSHQEFTIYRSNVSVLVFKCKKNTRMPMSTKNASVLVFKCKKAPECQ